MKKFLLISFALYFYLFGMSYVNAAVNVISRSQWGADEELTLKSAQQAPLTPTANDESEQPVTEAIDPDIERVVERDANGREYIWPLQYSAGIKFIVIHYTAVTRNLDNPIQDIRNIYHSHAVGRGWGDIGYNYLIDQQGNVYEGRKGGDGVVGGHATPVNKVSVGISLMGNYEDEELPAPMLKSLIDLIDRETAKFNIDPIGQTEYKGRSYPNIHGHEDNSAKIDPGRYGRQKIPFIRRLVAYQQGRITSQANEFSHISPKELVAIPPGEGKTFSIRIKNLSSHVWNAETYLENTDTPTLPRIFAVLTEPNVQPNGIAEFRATIPMQFESGMRLPVIKVVINGTVRTTKTFLMPLMIEALKADYEIVARSDPPALMQVGSSANAWIELRNTGNFSWKRSGRNPIKIGTLREKDHESSLFKGKNRIARLTTREVRPGETGRFVFKVEAGGPAQTYDEYFAPVIDGVAWFPDKGLHFSVAVEDTEKPLRVAITAFKKSRARVKSENGMTISEGQRIFRTVGRNKSVTVSLNRNGKYKVKIGGETLELTSQPRFQANEGGILTVANFSNKPAWNPALNDNMYRGTLEFREINNKLTLINELSLEDYLKGLAEVSNGDPPEKIKTIIILARSYAKYYRDVGRKFPGKPYHLDDDPDHTQKYLGYGIELRSPNIVSAVSQTAGKIVTYQGRQVVMPYFSQSDGRTRSAIEVWGWTNAPYLESVADNFCGSTQLRGHGVGLSGCGATALANQGRSAEQIINYYYRGVEITD